MLIELRIALPALGRRRCNCGRRPAELLVRQMQGNRTAPRRGRARTSASVTADFGVRNPQDLKRRQIAGNGMQGVSTINKACSNRMAWMEL